MSLPYVSRLKEGDRKIARVLSEFLEEGFDTPNEFVESFGRQRQIAEPNGAGSGTVRLFESDETGLGRSSEPGLCMTERKGADLTDSLGSVPIEERFAGSDCLTCYLEYSLLQRSPRALVDHADQTLLEHRIEVVVETGDGHAQFLGGLLGAPWNRQDLGQLESVGGDEGIEAFDRVDFEDFWDGLIRHKGKIHSSDLNVQAIQINPRSVNETRRVRRHISIREHADGLPGVVEANDLHKVPCGHQSVHEAIGSESQRSFNEQELFAERERSGPDMSAVMIE